jgi:hypothetical protein
MKRLVPYEPDSSAPAYGAQLFYVDPTRLNDGSTSPLGSVANYPYQLPFLGKTLPVRRIRVQLDTTYTPVPGIGSTFNAMLTLRRADGIYLLDAVPCIEFQDNLPGLASYKPLQFDDEFFPDPRFSFLTWTVAGVTARAALEFIY